MAISIGVHTADTCVDLSSQRSPPALVYSRSCGFHGMLSVDLKCRYVSGMKKCFLPHPHEPTSRNVRVTVSLVDCHLPVQFLLSRQLRCQSCLQRLSRKSLFFFFFARCVVVGRTLVSLLWWERLPVLCRRERPLCRSVTVGWEDSKMDSNDYLRKTRKRNETKRRNFLSPLFRSVCVFSLVRVRGVVFFPLKHVRFSFCAAPFELRIL